MDLAKAILASNIPVLVFLLLAVALFYRPVRDRLLPRVSAFKAFGIEASFAAARADLQEAVKVAPVAFSDEDRSGFIASVIARATLVEGAIHGAHLLWVDDHPDRNNYERRVLTRLGIVCDLALTNGQAVKMATHGGYDLVITDMARDAPQSAGTPGEGAQAGESLIAALRGANPGRLDYPKPPVVIYAAGWDPGRKTPAYAVGMTNRPDELLHYVMDVLERRRSVDAVRRMAETQAAEWATVTSQASRTSVGPPAGTN